MESFLGLLRIGGALMIVLGAIAMTAYLAKRFVYPRLGLAQTPIQLLATTYLGAKKQISLIEVGGVYLLVGITPTQISLLTQMEKFPLDRGASDPGQIVDPQSAFGHLGRLFGKGRPS